MHLAAVHAAWTEQRRLFELRALLRSVARHQHGFHVLSGDTDAREEYDFTADILSESWNRRSAIRKVRTHGRKEIADVLLDQSIFAGVSRSSPA